MVTIAHASANEKGKVSGGTAGDQNGKEVCIRSWYNRPWNVIIRLKEKSMRDRLAYAMKSAADNNFIGYNQLKRNTLLTFARFVGYDLSKVTTPCDTDCSALVSVACMYAGIPETVLFKGGNCSTTANLKSRLKPYSTFYTSKDYTTKSDKLEIGDILLYENHHVAVVIATDTAKVLTPIKADNRVITDIAHEVISGKWGTGNDRKQRLTEAGYNYTEVQAEVNRILKG